MSAPSGSRAVDYLTELFLDPLDPAYQAAARRRAARGPDQPWVRRSARAGSLLTVALVGLLFAVAYRSVAAAEPESGRTRAGLVAEVHSHQAAGDELSHRAQELRDEVDRLRRAALAEGEAARLRTLAAAAGLGRVRGDAVLVEVADAPDAADPVTGQAGGENLGRVRDQDLQAVVNALWNAGAEAVAINGQRLSGTATIRRAGAAILVDFKPVASPYRVVAIGPPDLDRRFERSPTGELFRLLSRTYGMSLRVSKQPGVTLPAATDPQLRYARRPGTAPPASPVPEPSATGGR